MKLFLKIICTLFFQFTVLVAQWSQQISPITPNYASIHFFDSNNGWAFGASGSVKTANGGSNWTDQSTNYGFKKVSVVDQNNVFALVGDKSVYKTTDGGTTWTQCTTPAWAPPVTTLDGIAFVSANVGFVGGTNGYIFKTVNGGSNWSLASNGGFYISDLFFLDANNGFAARWGGQWSKTTDGGASWSGGANGANNFYSVFALDANNVFLAGANGLVYKTTNGGTNWGLGSTNTTEILYSVKAVSTTTVWAAGANGTIIQSTDGANTWTPQASGITQAIRGLFFANANLGWAVGDGGKILKYSIKNIVLTSPNGGESWEIGQNKNITWTSSGITNAKIEYSTNNGTNWITIIASTPAAPGTYSWTIPNTPTAQGLVRISDASDAATNDVSNASFTIPSSSIIVTSPNGGETWISGSERNITWNSTSVARVKIEYTTDNGGSWITITNNAAAANGSIVWMVPNVSTVYGKIKISDVSNSTINDVSDNVFIIPAIRIAAPNGGEILYVGETYNIRWTSVGVMNVFLRYRTGEMADNTWINIGTESASKGYYEWVIPNRVGENCIVQIMGDNNPSLIDWSDAIFTIRQPYVTLVSPNGGENWKVGSSHEIKWLSEGVNLVKLEYSTDNGASWNFLAENVNASLHKLNWAVPNIPGNRVIVRIINQDNNLIRDVSDSTFSIYLSSIQVTSPNGGEEWWIRKFYRVTWTSINVNKVRIDISYDNGGTWYPNAQNISAALGERRIQMVWASEQTLVRIVDEDDSTTFDQSDAVFIIAAPVLTLTAPVGGEFWIINNSYNITWQSKYSRKIKIEYLYSDLQDEWQYSSVIADSVLSATGTFPWSFNFRYRYIGIRLTDIDYPQYSVESRAISVIDFKIITQFPKLVVGAHITLQWHIGKMGSYRLEFSPDNGNNWISILDHFHMDTQSYEWTIPDIITRQGIFRITDLDNPGLLCDTRANPTTISKLKFTGPSLGDNWLTGSKKNISWTSANVDTLTLYYVKGGEQDIHIIAKIPASSGFYEWTVPEDPSNDVEIFAVESFENFIPGANAFERSGRFGIYTTRSITLLAPNGGEKYVSGTRTSITWQSEGINSLKIEYKIGETWTEIANNVSAYLGRYDWLIPENDNTLSYKIRISSMDNPSIKDESDDYFKTYLIKILIPNGGEKFAWGTKQVVKWYDSDRNAIGKLLEYSSDNGRSWNILGHTQDKDWLHQTREETINWNIVDFGTATFPPSTLYKVRVTDRFTSTLTDQCDGTFEIYKPNISLSYPNGGEEFEAKDRILVVFYANESITRINLDYTTDNGTIWNSILSNYDVGLLENQFGFRTYYWKAPRFFSNNYKIRIADASNSNNSDLSDAPFLIKQRSIDIIYPEENTVYSVGELVTYPTMGDYVPIDVSHYIGGVTYNYTNHISVRAQVSGYSRYVNYFILDLEDCNKPQAVHSQYHPTGEQEISFSIPITYCRNGTYRIQVWGSDAANSGSPGSGEHDELTVTIKPIPFKVNSPGLSERISVGKPLRITWDIIDPTVQNVKIELHSSSGTILIAENIPSIQKEFVWQVPESLLGVHDAVLEISDSNQHTYHARQYNLSFKIYEEITIIEPNANTLWKIGSVKQIRWRSLNVPKVRIEWFNPYLNFGTWCLVDTVSSTTSPINDGVYSWTVPGQVYPITYEQIRISKSDDSSVKATSDQFTVAQISLTLLSPRESMIWKVGETELIDWKAVNIDTVKIEYSTDDGISWLTIASKVKCNQNISDHENRESILAWTIPNTPSTKVKIRITNIRDGNYSDQTNSSSTILQPTLLLTYPKDESRILAKQNISIKWQSSNIDFIDVEYSTNNGQTWHQADLYPVHAFLGYLYWETPGIESSQCKVRVKESYTHSVYSENNLPFTIGPKTPPLLASNEWNNALNFREGDNPKPIISDLYIDNYNKEIQHAYIRIKNSEPDSIRSRYNLSFEPIGQMTGTYDAANQRMVLTDLIKPEDFKTAIQSVKFKYTGDPHKLDGVVYNTLSLIVFDGTDYSNEITRPMTFTSVNSTPVISDNSGNNYTYTLGDAPLNIVPNLSINDDVNLRKTGVLEVKVTDNHITDEDLLGASASNSVQSIFTKSESKLMMTETNSAPKEILRLAKDGIYYLVDGGTKSINKTKKLELQYFDDYNVGSNKLVKYVTVKVPSTINTKIPPPAELKIEYVTGGNIKVSWKDPSGKAKGFIIYRSLPTIGKAKTLELAVDEIIGIVPAGQLSFVDSTAVEGNNYNYQVAAFDQTGLADVSSQSPVTANVIIKPPTNLTYKVTNANTAQLNWEDNSEIEEGFILELKETIGNNFISYVQLKKNTTNFSVTNLTLNKTYTFRVRSFNSVSQSEPSNIIEVKLTTTDIEKLGFIPDEYALFQNFPNPFNPETIISYQIPKAQNVIIKVYNALGTEVTTLVNEYKNAGIYYVTFSIQKLNLSSGIYFYRLTAGEYSSIKKMLLIK